MDKPANEPIANCPACREFLIKYPWTGREHVGTDGARVSAGRMVSPIRCAFDDEGVFTDDNWMCASMVPLNRIAWEVEVTADVDQHVATVVHRGAFIVLSYYKRRGGTDGAWVVEENVIRPLRLSDLYAPTSGDA